MFSFLGDGVQNIIGKGNPEQGHDVHRDSVTFQTVSVQAVDVTVVKDTAVM